MTGGEFPAGLGLLRGVARAGDQAIAVVVEECSLAAASRLVSEVVIVPDPHLEPAAFAEAVADAARRYKADAILPGTEASMRQLSLHRLLLPDSAVLGCPDTDVVLRACDKMALVDLARAGGLATPFSQTLESADAYSWDGGFPAVVKPVTSEVDLPDGTTQHATASRVYDHAALGQALAELPQGSGLVQPYVEGLMRTIDGLAWKGDVVSTGQKVAERLYPRDCGMLTYGRTVAVDHDLDERARAMMAELGWSGLFNIQLIQNDSGLYVIDLNARAWNSIASQLAAGANMPGLWLDLLLGRTARPAVPRVGVRFRSEVEDLRSIRGAWREGARTEALCGLVPRPQTSHAIFDWGDPQPALRMIKRLIKTRSADARNRHTPGLLPSGHPWEGHLVQRSKGVLR